MPIAAILFDAYGTLLDIHAAMAAHQARIGPRAPEISALWRQKQLEYTWTLTLAQDYRPFDVVTAEALDFALAQHGIDDAALRADLLATYRVLPPFPEVVGALATLRRMGLRLGVLSNGTGAMLDAAFATAGLDEMLDPILSVDALRIYKPDPRVYAMATNALALAASEIGFVSSNAWDAMGAARFGFRVFWLRRRPDPVEYDLNARATPIAHLGEIAAALSQ